MKIIIKWCVIGFLLLVVLNVILLFVPSISFRAVLSFFGGMLIGSVCMLMALNEYICTKN